MLKQRVITALILLLFLLPALFYVSPWPLVALALIMISAGAWEWSRLNGYGQVMSLAWGGVCALACAATWWLGLLERSLGMLWIFAGATWVLASAWLLRAGVSAWSSYPRPLRLLSGLFALWLAWLAVWLDGWLPAWLCGHLVSWLPDQLAGWLPGCLAG